MLYPMIAMVFLSYSVMIVTFVTRVRAVKDGRVPFSYFKTFEGDVTDKTVIKTSRHFSNLFEVPVLFYAACLSAMMLQLEVPVMLLLGWLYVLFRVVHAIIHITYNNVTHRLYAFMKSNFCLLGIWIIILLESIP